jgi:RNA polymerase sigma-B factor
MYAFRLDDVERWGGSPPIDVANPAEVAAAIVRYQRSGDPEALQRVMAAFDWLAVAAARRMHRRGEPIEDLEQVAREAVLGAIMRFDPQRGVPFRAFAWATVVGVLRHHYRSRWQVRVPRGMQELYLAAVKASEELAVAAGRGATVDEIAARLSVDREDILIALEAGHAYRAGSFEQSPAEGAGNVPDEDRSLGQVDEVLEATAIRSDLRRMIASLPERQRRILVMRFFEERTQAEIGGALGISQVHVSRLMRAALATLRAASDGSPPRSAVRSGWEG